MWAMGRYETTRLPAYVSMGNASLRHSIVHVMLLWSSITPLLGPVVPDVKMTVARSLGEATVAASARSSGSEASRSAQVESGSATPSGSLSRQMCCSVSSSSRTLRKPSRKPTSSRMAVVALLLLVR